MKNKTLSIRQIVSYLNTAEHEGGLWLPNIQRPFVWSEDQIARLFDSIMREYPISTLLVWKTKETVKHRKFIDNYHRDIRLTDFYVPENSTPKLLVLDGQQRLQSLYIGLKGSYAGTDRELYLDILSGDRVAPEDIRYRFAFIKKAEAKWPWIRFKDIIAATPKMDIELAQEFLELSPSPLLATDAGRVQRNVARARHEFVYIENVTYQELDSIDNPHTYQPDDIVEIFIRANSGGTKLGKSDLLFSLLISSWDDADRRMEDLLEELNQGGFDFDRDFVLKCCLTVLGKGARYEVEKFRQNNTRDEIIDKWQEISDAIRDVRDFVVNKTYIRTDKALPSYLALIPLIYFRYHYPLKFKSTPKLAEFLLRSLITGVFSGNPDNLIDKIVRNIQDQQGFVLSEVFSVIRADNRSLEITPDVIFNQTYGSRTIHLFFNLWYQSFDYTPALGDNGPQVDHIFPQSLLRTVKVANKETGILNVMRYRAEQRDQIANCMLLSAKENGFSGKVDMPPAQWFARARFASDEEQAAYFKLHLIPPDPELWKLENFEKFVEARKALIADKFSYMLHPAGGKA